MSAAAALPLTIVRRDLAQRYTIKVRDSGWAVILLDEPTGAVAIVSDYGNWGYMWPNHGRASLKHFLAEGPDHDYLCNKFGGGRKHFNAERTVAAMRREIREQRKTGDLDKATARAAWEQLGRIADEYWMSRDLFFAVGVYQHNALNRVFPDVSELAVVEYDPQLVMFMQRLWPAFVSVLAGELAQATDRG